MGALLLYSVCCLIYKRVYQVAGLLIYHRQFGNDSLSLIHITLLLKEEYNS